MNAQRLRFHNKNIYIYAMQMFGLVIRREIDKTIIQKIYKPKKEKKKKGKVKKTQL